CPTSTFLVAAREYRERDQGQRRRRPAPAVIADAADPTATAANRRAGLGGVPGWVDGADRVDIVVGQRLVLGLAAVLEVVHRCRGNLGGGGCTTRGHRVSLVVRPGRIAGGETGVLEAMDVAELVGERVEQLGVARLGAERLAAVRDREVDT